MDAKPQDAAAPDPMPLEKQLPAGCEAAPAVVAQHISIGVLALVPRHGSGVWLRLETRGLHWASPAAVLQAGTSRSACIKGVGSTIELKLHFHPTLGVPGLPQPLPQLWQPLPVPAPGRQAQALPARAHVGRRCHLGRIWDAGEVPLAQQAATGSQRHHREEMWLVLVRCEC